MVESTFRRKVRDENPVSGVSGLAKVRQKREGFMKIKVLKVVLSLALVLPVLTGLGNPLPLLAKGAQGKYEAGHIKDRGATIIGRAETTAMPMQAHLQAPAKVDIATRFEISWQGPGNDGDYIAIAKPGAAGGESLQYEYTAAGDPVEMSAPAVPGTYEIRYILGRGDKILARRKIEITSVRASVKGPISAAMGSTIEVSWQGPNSEGDYIAVAAPAALGGESIHYEYTAAGDPLKLMMPSTAGNYELRYILGEGDRILARSAITIKQVEASIAAPDTAPAASTIMVKWQGPDGDGDYIGIAAPEADSGDAITYEYTTSGNPVQLKAPSEPGTYELRYILGHDDRLLAKRKIVIKPVNASLEAPSVVDMAGKFQVKWQGPNADGDYIGIAAPDAGDDDIAHYEYTSAGNPVTLRAPSKPGTYELRYVLGQDDTVLAKRKIEVKPVAASLRAPATAGVSDTIEVGWQGPNGDSDYIAIARPEQEDSSYLHYQYTASGNPVTIRTPDQPGNYEIRYVLGDGDRVLASVKLKVK